MNTIINLSKHKDSKGKVADNVMAIDASIARLSSIVILKIININQMVVLELPKPCHMDEYVAKLRELYNVLKDDEFGVIDKMYKVNKIFKEVTLIDKSDIYLLYEKHLKEKYPFEVEAQALINVINKLLD